MQRSNGSNEVGGDDGFGCHESELISSLCMAAAAEAGFEGMLMIGAPVMSEASLELMYCVQRRSEREVSVQSRHWFASREHILA